MVDLLLVWISLRVALTDTLGDHAGIALSVTCIFAVLTLHSGRVLEEIATERTPHDVVELMLNKFMSIHFVNLFLALANGAFPAEADINRPAVLACFDEAHLKLDLSRRLQVKPAVDWTCIHLRLGPWGAVRLTLLLHWGCWAHRSPGAGWTTLRWTHWEL